MEVMRNMTIDTELFELGDIISFTLTTGEKVKAKAIRETPNGMLFITVDCLKDEQKMFENPGRAEKVDYEHSDLRKKLNGEIFESFPEEIKGRMVGMRVGQTNCFDMLRIPTEREIFGENPYGKDEPVSDASTAWRTAVSVSLSKARRQVHGNGTGCRIRLRIPLPISPLSATPVVRTPATLPILLAFARSFSYPKISPPCGASSIKNGGECRADKM